MLIQMADAEGLKLEVIFLLDHDIILGSILFADKINRKTSHHYPLLNHTDISGNNTFRSNPSPPPDTGKSLRSSSPPLPGAGIYEMGSFIQQPLTFEQVKIGRNSMSDKFSDKRASASSDIFAGEEAANLRHSSGKHR